MPYSYQALDSVTGGKYVWTTTDRDPTGVHYPGPNSPTDLLQTSVPLAPAASTINLGYLTFGNTNAFRSYTSEIPDGTIVKIASPNFEGRYSVSSGAGWADDDRTILKQFSVSLGSNGRLFSTASGAVCPTFDALRGLVSGKQDHVHVQSHTKFGDGGGDLFDQVAVGSYVDDGGTVVVAGSYAYVRRDRLAAQTNARWWGGRGDWDPNTDTGGELDNEAIVAAVAFATANNTVAYIPAGPKCWLIDATRVNVAHNTKIRGDGWQKTNIATKLSAGIYVGIGAYGASNVDFAYNWALEDFSIVYFGGFDGSPATIACLIDVVASAQGKIWEVGVGGRVANGIRSVRTAAWPGDCRGENYFLHMMLRTARPVIGARYPLRFDVQFRNYGALNGSTLSGHCQLPLVAGAIIGGEPGNEGQLEWGSNIRIKDYHVEGDATPGTIGVKALAIQGLTIDHCYGEGIGTILDLTACHLVYFVNTYGGTNYFRECRGVTAGPNYAHTEYVDCTGVTELTGGSFSPDPKALGMNNLSVVTLGHGNEAGVSGKHPIVGVTPGDLVNLAPNGDFQRWFNSTAPWGWKPLGGYVMAMTKCGDGLADTTRTRGVPFCAKISSQSIQFLPITGPLGEQYLNTTLTISVKVKMVASFLSASLTYGATQNTTNSRVLSAANTWCPCPAEDAGDDWRICTFAWIIDANMCANGITLQLNSISDTEAYISELMVTFGVGVPRSFVRARETFGGAVQILDGGKLQIASAAIPGATDAWATRVWREGDIAISTTSGKAGWIYSSIGSWVEIAQDEVSVLTKRLVAATGSKLVRAVFGEDLPESGNITTWPARVGAACPAADAGYPVVGSLRGRKAAVFSAGATAMGLTFTGSMPEYWAVARWDGTLPFAS